MKASLKFVSSRQGRRCLRARFLPALLLVLFARGAPVQAGLVLDVSVMNVTVSPGGSGSFDVLVGNDVSSTENVSLAGFSIDLTVPSGSGITLIGASISTTAPYVFAGNSLGFVATVTSTEVQASDFAAAGGTLLSPGDTALGLAHISFSTAADTPPGAIPVSLFDYQGGTSLSDTNASNLTFTIDDGQITVSNASIPEPSTVVLAGIALSIGLLLLRRR